MRGLLCLVAAACAAPAGGAPRPSPGPSELPGATSAARFPLPPMQHVPWSSTARLPRPVIEAARAMFLAGLADPRGCEYRAIEIAVGSARSPVATRGFVLPGERFAVAWNGLVYPVAALGAPADLGGDVAAAATTGGNPQAPMLLDERRSVLPDRTLTMVVMLARLGEDALAEQVWDRLRDPPDQAGDPFGELALGWVWRLFDRALAAHHRGDPALALESLRRLTAVAPVVDTAAALRGLRGPDGGTTFLDFLGPVPELLADEERRAARGPRPALPDAAQRSRLPVAERVALLIDRLDEVGAIGAGAGRVGAGDPIIDALVEIGAPAVEPLIDVVASDRRLTRAVMVPGEASFGRVVLGVHEAAYRALTAILRTRLVDADTLAALLSTGMTGRRALAERFRARVRRRAGLSVEQRWYEDLADFEARPELWLDAAEHITRDRSAGGRFGASWLVTGRIRPAAIGLGGEPLRGRAAPSVSELLARRIELADVPTACRLALRLDDWDPAAGARWLDWALTRAIGESGTTHQFAREIAQLTERRLAAGDLAVLDRYAAWLGAATLEAPTVYDVRVRFPLDAEVFRPMAVAPWRPSIVRAAEALFRDGSPWVPLLDRDRLHGDDPIALLDGELLAVAAFNRHVVKALGDPRPVGHVTVRGRWIDLQLDDGWALIQRPAPDAAPPDGTERVVRLADWYADRLAHGHARDGAPRFELTWSDAERDAALRAMVRWVRRRAAPPPSPPR